jgi:hypothetical protein
MIELYTDIHPEGCKAAYNRDTCTHMFIAAFFTIAKLWNQSRFLTTDEYVKKMWYIYTMEYYSSIENEIKSFVAKWMELDIIMLSEILQTEKDNPPMFSPICEIQT